MEMKLIEILIDLGKIELKKDMMTRIILGKKQLCVTFIGALFSEHDP